jgi:hypothetical protein
VGDAPSQLRVTRQDTQGEFDSKTRGAQMPTDSKPIQHQIFENTLRNFMLLALPWLSFHHEILEIAKKSIQDASHVKPTERFALSELQALMMILDRSRTLRNLFDQDFEKRVEDACKEIFPKIASASVQLIEAQEVILTSTIDALNTLRKGDKAKNHSSSRH